MYIGKHNAQSCGDANSPKREKTHKMGVMDIILVVVAVTLLIFTAAMILLFALFGSIPDTLCTCVFAVLGGECGVMGWIKTNKDKIRDRQWEKEEAAGKETEND